MFNYDFWCFFKILMRAGRRRAWSEGYSLSRREIRIQAGYWGVDLECEEGDDIAGEGFEGL